MSIRSAVAYLASRSVPEGAGPPVLVEDATGAGYAFDVVELRRVIVARDALAQVSLDDSLRGEVLAAASPSAALRGVARSLGAEADDEALAAVLEALFAASTELDDCALESVTAGASSFALPEVDDEVIVSFLQGDLRRPIVIGSLWNGKDRPPE